MSASLPSSIHGGDEEEVPLVGYTLTQVSTAAGVKSSSYGTDLSRDDNIKNTDNENVGNNDLPSNVSRVEQLSQVPDEFLNHHDDTEGCRPLQHIDDCGRQYIYSLRPMVYSVSFILIVELLERFSFYGIYYTQTLFLTGVYNDEWNAGFTSIKASSFVSISTMVAYTTPFVGAFMADTVWGDYRSIVIGLVVFYLPGVLLVALTTVPYLLGDEFNDSLLTLGVLFLWPMGTGIVKSIVNVFGAKQFHPILQSSLIESYYVNFYMAINVGALAGIGIVPIMAQHNLTLAYFCPFALLVIGLLVFLSGTSRYVCSPPRGELLQDYSGTGGSGKKNKKRGRGRSLDHRATDSSLTNATSNNTISLFTIFRISLLIVPFCIGYNQMPTTFIVQGAVMNKAFGFIDVASMNSLDAISVLVFGYLTASYVYPTLAKRNIKIPTTYKFAIGSILGALAICWSLYVEHLIHTTYDKYQRRVSVLWQAPAYILIGWGEIFAVSSAYEVAFTASSPDKKALASATNIFCVGGLPNLLCIVLYHSCSRWFMNSRGTTNIQYIEDYATAHVGYYFLVLLCIMLFGAFINVLPFVKDFVDSIEEQATEIIKTPVLVRKNKDGSATRSPNLVAGGGRTSQQQDQSPTIPLTPQSKRHYQKYMKQIKGRKIPVLYKLGSMRAGPSSVKPPKK